MTTMSTTPTGWYADMDNGTVNGTVTSQDDDDEHNTDGMVCRHGQRDRQRDCHLAG